MYKRNGGDKMNNIEIYSEKLDTMIKVNGEILDDEIREFTEDESTSLVGWTHGGWNNSGGGGSW